MFGRDVAFTVESELRRLFLQTFLINDATLTKWGSLLTRFAPVGDHYLVAGLSTDVVVLRVDGNSAAVCGTVPGTGIVHDVAVVGHAAYVAAGSDNLRWLGFDEPCDMAERASYAMGGYGFAIEPAGTTLYLANRGGGVAAFAIDPDGRPRYRGLALGERWPNERHPVWMAQDMRIVGRDMYVADGIQGLVHLAAGDGASRIHTVGFPSGTALHPIVGNVDPAPLRIVRWGTNLFLAMRDQGVAAYSLNGGASPRLVGTFRPDGGEVLDLAVADGNLFVASTSGRVLRYDARGDDDVTNWSPAHSWSIGEHRPIHSVVVRPPYVFAGAVGAGIYRGRLDGTELQLLWRPRDDVRDLARVGDFIVAALGSGGVAVYVRAGASLREIERASTGSFAFSLAPHGQRTDVIAVASDVSGTAVLRLDTQGTIKPLAYAPTPEHAFAASFAESGVLYTANGARGILGYTLDTPTLTAARPMASSQPPREDGYVLQVLTWQGQALGLNIAGEVQLMDDALNDTHSGARDRARLLRSTLRHCLTGEVSTDGQRLAVACDGNDVHLFAGDRGEVNTVSVPSNVTSVYPGDGTLFAGAVDGNIYVVSTADQRIVASLAPAGAAKGIPHAIVPVGDEYLVAYGTGGIARLWQHGAAWSLDILRAMDAP